MIDRQQSKLEDRDVNVRVHTEGVAPCIPIGHDQLDDVTQILEAHGFVYTVDLNAAGAGNEPVAAVNLGAGADVRDVQAALDAHTSGGEEDDADEDQLPAEQPLTLHMRHRVDSGAFSTIFRHAENGRVYKLFKEHDQSNQLGDLGDQEPVLRRAAFNSEVEAYQIAMEVDAIRPLIPKFHGPVVVDQVLDENDTDISDRYLLDCCYAIDFVEGGPPAKFAPEVAAQHPHLQALTAAFAANGINYWHDGAVFNPANPAMTKVVDFALKDEYGDGALAIALAE
jgi:hypothetical protein